MEVTEVVTEMVVTVMEHLLLAVEEEEEGEMRRATASNRTNKGSLTVSCLPMCVKRT